MTPLRTDARGRETRLGLVIYGGVSLAIYTNGVTREFFEAVRGRGIYRLLKRLTDADIVVDIVSGTSAGGINGVFLGYALCNQIEFAECARLWRQHGGIVNLLRDLDGDPDHYTSLLDSEGYYLPRIEEALATMATNGAARPNELVSEMRELDLFVTGTDYDGRVERKTDATGRQIDVKDHKTVFHLKHRGRRKTPFASSDETGRNALAKLCTITSCFPAAFTPVRVTPNGSPCVDERLAEWGLLGGERFFLDGGVLDNKPFTHTIREIFHRTADRPVTRKLFYIEPDPERFEASPPKREHPPSVPDAVRQALLGIPGYESIGDDLAMVATRNDKIERFSRIERALRAYLGGREATDAAAVSECTRLVYEQARLLQICARTIEGILHTPGDNGGKRSPDRALREKELVDAFYDWDGDGKDTLERFDVYFRVRRVFHLTYRVAEELDGYMASGGSDPERIGTLQETWRRLNHVLKLLEIVQARMESLIDDCDVNSLPLDGARIWMTLDQRFGVLLAVDGPIEALLPDPADRPEVRDRFAEILDERVDALRNGKALSTTGRTILQMLDAVVEGPSVLGPSPSLREALRRFPELDAYLFPIEHFADLGEKDPISIVRVSPIDAVGGFCRQGAGNKVTGDTLMHFSAFLKRSWRSNDILWGRLDGSCRLLDALLTTETLETALASPAARQRLRDDPAIAPKDLFPRSDASIQASLAAWIVDLASDDADIRGKAIKNTAMRDVLLTAAQLEIIGQDLKCVMLDAAEEQFEWNAFAVPAARKTATPVFDPNGMRFTNGPATFDPLSVVIATRHMTEAAFADLSTNGAAPAGPPGQTVLGSFFTDSYRVGAETLEKSIPPLVLLEVLTHALMVFRNCLLQAFPRGRDRVTSSWVYRLFVDYPLRAAHTFAVLGRRAPAGQIAMIAAMFAVALALLGVAGLHPQILHKGGDTTTGLQPWRLATFVVAPLLVLFAGGQFLWLRVRQHHWLVMVIGAALVGVTVLALTLLAVAMLASAAGIAATLAALAQTWLRMSDGAAATLGWGALALLALVPFLAARVRRAIVRSAWARTKRLAAMKQRGQNAEQAAAGAAAPTITTAVKITTTKPPSWPPRPPANDGPSPAP